MCAYSPDCTFHNSETRPLWVDDLKHPQMFDSMLDVRSYKGFCKQKMHIRKQPDLVMFCKKSSFLSFRPRTTQRSGVQSLIWQREIKTVPNRLSSIRVDWLFVRAYRPQKSIVREIPWCGRESFQWQTCCNFLFSPSEGVFHMRWQPIVCVIFFAFSDLIFIGLCTVFSWLSQAKCEIFNLFRLKLA